MLLKQILMYVLFAFFVLGMFDRAIGGQIGIGKEFTRAMDLLGLITLSIVGMICLTPVIARVLSPIVTPLYVAIGADPAMFAPNFIAVDCGGYSISTAMAEDPMIGRWAGVCVGSMLGANLSFNIPVMFSLIGKENNRIFSIGALSALIVAPLGCVIGGLVFGLSLLTMLHNLLPVLVVSLLIALCLILVPDTAIRVFQLFSRFLMILIAFGMSLAVLTRLTGIVILKDMLPLSDGLLISGTIAITCAGAICMIYVLLHFFGEPIKRFGRRLGLNEVALLNILIGFSSIAPGGASFSKMNPRGKIVFSVVSCSCANLLGAHLGFVASQDPEMLPILYIGKLSCFVIALPIALAFAKRLLPKEESTEVPEPVTEANA